MNIKLFVYSLDMLIETQGKYHILVSYLICCLFTLKVGQVRKVYFLLYFVKTITRVTSSSKHATLKTWDHVTCLKDMKDDLEDTLIQKYIYFLTIFNLKEDLMIDVLSRKY